jgi:hypothetical protein
VALSGLRSIIAFCVVTGKSWRGAFSSAWAGLGLGSWSASLTSFPSGPFL